jgi:hypothetical protein
MVKNDFILISWPARDFEVTILPIINDLTDKFKIIIFVVNVSINEKLNSQLIKLKKDEVIVDFFISPKKIHGLLFHIYLKKTMFLLKKYKIKLWLCSSDMQIAEKYISKMLLNFDSKTVCLWPPITYLFMYNQGLAKKLLKKNDYCEDEINQSKFKIFSKSKLRNFFKKEVRPSKHYFFHKTKILLQYIFIVFSKCIYKILNWYVYPFFINGQFQNQTKLESMTQLSDGNASAYIFFDSFEVEAHKKLYKNNNIYLSYINQNKEYKNNLPTNKVLGILSGWESEKLLKNDILELFVKDFISVCKIYNTSFIDLRPHPDMHPKYNYSSQIANILTSKGFNCQVTNCQDAVTEQSLDYCCIAGFASAALRDVRLFNHSIDVIGFESVSEKYFSESKFAFGSSDGIDWLNSNGDVILSKKINFDGRLSISDIIANVYYENK